MKIKFRVWDTDENIYRYFYLGDEDVHWMACNFSNFNNNLQQFTGMLDKNGKEIYVGDLIKIDNTICSYEYLLDQNNEVVFDYYSFGMKTKDKAGNKQFSHLGNFEPKDLEVVENIFKIPN